MNQAESSINSLPCAEKLAFDSQKQAKTAVVVARLQHGTKLKTYNCRYCGLWHLASS
ncbi:hypothetical protein KDA11_06480 [Candidatus Saccharibacteria bacterium]|nr:hypothetical protein [Candidatus Saccharibacteria bacterium]